MAPPSDLASTASIASSHERFLRAQSADPRLTDARAMVSLWLLLGLVAILLPAWLKAGVMYEVDVVGVLADPWLPVAVAMLLSVRAGGLNLSVWGCASLGSAVAWLMIALGHGVLALPAAMLVGFGAGVVQAEAFRRLRIPGVVVTAAGGLAAMALSRAVVNWAQLSPLSTEALGSFSVDAVRLILAAGLYGGTLLILTILDKPSSPWQWPTMMADVRMYAALVAGGALAAGGGAIILINQSAYVSQAWLVTDLRVPTAVLLCGAWVWRGRGGTLIAGVLLPAAMLVTTIWLEMVPTIVFSRYQGPVATLGAMVLGLQFLVRRRRWGWRAACGLGWAGVAVTAAGVNWPISFTEVILVRAGFGIWIVGMVVGLLPFVRKTPKEPTLQETGQ
ncbi:MAG: hypothetical protein HQ546_09175 [Planctomycetes bacterium]|nr:hypothetical protein [Planctomycetota bacterium]